MVGQRIGRVPPVEAIELIAAGDHVVMSVRGVGIGPPVDDDENEARGHATVVYTLVDGKIVRMHDYLLRVQALEAVGRPWPGTKPSGRGAGFRRDWTTHRRRGGRAVRWPGFTNTRCGYEMPGSN